MIDFSEGQFSWAYNPPPKGFLVQACRNQGEPFTLFPEDMQPAANINGLRWRFTAIGRIKWESLSPETQAQLLPSILAWTLSEGGSLGVMGYSASLLGESSVFGGYSDSY